MSLNRSNSSINKLDPRDFLEIDSCAAVEASPELRAKEFLRYSGQRVRPGLKVAVIANDAIGNFVVATPMLQIIRDRWEPSSLTFFGGTRTCELEEASDLIQKCFSLHSNSEGEVERIISENLELYDLVVNLENSHLAKRCASLIVKRTGQLVGASYMPGELSDLGMADDIQGDLSRDEDWTRASLSSEYEILDSGFIGEIFCRLCYFDGAVPEYKVPKKSPQIELPSILISMVASLPEKLWPYQNWKRVIDYFDDQQLTVGLLGACPDTQKTFWQGAEDEDRLIANSSIVDLRGTLSLPEVVGALEMARLVVTLDNGILHLAAAAKSPTVGLFRYGIHRLWAPNFGNLKILLPSERAPVSNVLVETVIDACQQFL